MFKKKTYINKTIGNKYNIFIFRIKDVTIFGNRVPEITHFDLYLYC